MKKGITGYFKRYITPTPFMLPFNIISDLSRTLALAVRLFGNIMSGSLIVAILISVVPLFVPIVMRVLGLLIGLIQAYIFTILAAVYIGSATRRQLGEEQNRLRGMGSTALCASEQFSKEESAWKQPDLIGMWSIIIAGMTIAIGSIGPAIGEAMALSRRSAPSRSSPTNRAPSPEPCSWASRWSSRRPSTVSSSPSFCSLPIPSQGGGGG